MREESCLVRILGRERGARCRRWVCGIADHELALERNKHNSPSRRYVSQETDNEFMGRCFCVEGGSRVKECCRCNGAGKER